MGLDVALFGSDLLDNDARAQDGEFEQWHRELWQRVAGVIPSLRDLILDEVGSEDLLERVGPYTALHQLREYAVHIELHGCPPDHFQGTEGSILAPVYSGERPSERFVHLVDFSDHQGWYVPLGLPTPVWIGLGGGDVWAVGSSVALLRELGQLRPYLGVSGDYGELRERGADPGDLFAAEASPAWPWAVLHWAARLSVERNLVLEFC